MMIANINSSCSNAALVSLTPSQQNRYTCLCCRIKFDSLALQRDHFKTDWHLYNLKRKVCDLEPLDLENFKQIQETSMSKEDDETTLYGSIVDNNSPNKLGTKHNEDNDSLGDDWEAIDVEELIDEDYEDDETADMLAKIVSPDTCLFCDKKSPSIKSNLGHMSLMHGFFIPEERYLIDLDGFMEYLGFKVGAGATCLWCNKQFKSLHGVRLHMIYKDHCKILYEHSAAVQEFKDFYDYSKQEQFEMKPLNQLVLPTRQFERRSKRNNSLVENDDSFDCAKGVEQQQQLVVKGKKCLFNKEKKVVKKFDAYRAKILLRAGVSNNNTLRARLRQQNPI